MGMITWEVYQNYVYWNDMILGLTVDPSGLLGPPGSSLLWSVTWIVFL